MVVKQFLGALKMTDKENFFFKSLWQKIKTKFIVSAVKKYIGGAE